MIEKYKGHALLKEIPSYEDSSTLDIYQVIDREVNGRPRASLHTIEVWN